MGTDVRSAADEAVAILSDLLEQEPSNREYRLELARAHRRVASLGRLGNDRSTAVAALAAAIDQLTRLVQDSPRSPVYRFELATTLCVRVSGNRIEQAVRSARAVSLARELTGEYPGIAEYQMLLATALQLRNAFRRGEPENEPALQEVVGIFRDLHRRYPEIFEYRLGLCVALRNLSVHQQRDDRQKAAATAREAIALLQSIGSDGQLGPDHRRIVQALLARLAEQTRPPE